jgi:hypothetical protein
MPSPERGQEWDSKLGFADLNSRARQDSSCTAVTDQDSGAYRWTRHGPDQAEAL